MMRDCFFSLIPKYISKIGKNVLFFFLLLLTTLHFAYSQNNSLEKLYYSNKTVELATYLFQYPEKYLISKEIAHSKTSYYIVYKGNQNQVYKEEFYLNNQLINHYEFKYDNGKLAQEEFYDNGILISIRKFFYSTGGVLIKIESYDRNKKRLGDWRFFNVKGELIQLDRYRDNVLSYTELYDDNNLTETRYFYKGHIYVTRFNLYGRVTTEEVVDELQNNQISIIDRTKNLLDFKSNDIVQFKVQSKDSYLLCKRDNEFWSIESGEKKFLADPVYVKSFMAIIKNMKYFRIYRGKAVLEQDYGFTNARNYFTLWFRNGRMLTVTVGNSFSEKSAYYVKTTLNDQEVYLISKFKINSILTKQINDFRAKNFTRHISKSVNSVTFDHLTFIKRNNNWYLANAPHVDQKMNRLLVNTLLNLRARRFLDSPTETRFIYKIEPRHKITLKTEDQTYHIYLYVEGGSLYAKVSYSKTIYELPSYLINYLSEKKESYLKYIRE